MQTRSEGSGSIALILNEDELLTLRHCVVEALEALGDDEFRIRTGGSKQAAEEVLAELKRAGLHFRGGN
jgi:hypothetical protein